MTRNLGCLSHAVAALCLFPLGSREMAQAQTPIFPMSPVGVGRPPVFVPAPSSPPFGSSPTDPGPVFQGPLILTPRLGPAGATVLTPSRILSPAHAHQDGGGPPGPEENCGSPYPIPHARLTCR